MTSLKAWLRGLPERHGRKTLVLSTDPAHSLVLLRAGGHWPCRCTAN